MNIIRKLIIGKEYTDNAMSYAVGQKVFRGKYVIDSILANEDGSHTIYITDKGEIMAWKQIHKDVATTLEYSLDF